jgi:hypothetical protein
MRANGVILAIGVLGLMAAGASAGAPKAEFCPKAGDMALRGTIHGIQSMREEPQAEVETFFTIDLPSPICGKSTVTASVIGLIPCSEGDAITMDGDFSPPSAMFDTARLHGDRGGITCTAAKP